MNLYSDNQASSRLQRLVWESDGHKADPKQHIKTLVVFTQTQAERHSWEDERLGFLFSLCLCFCVCAVAGCIPSSYVVRTGFAALLSDSHLHLTHHFNKGIYFLPSAALVFRWLNNNHAIESKLTADSKETTHQVWVKDTVKISASTIPKYCVSLQIKKIEWNQ